MICMPIAVGASAAASVALLLLPAGWASRDLGRMLSLTQLRCRCYCCDGCRPLLLSSPPPSSTPVVVAAAEDGGGR